VTLSNIVKKAKLWKIIFQLSSFFKRGAQKTALAMATILLLVAMLLCCPKEQTLFIVRPGSSSPTDSSFGPIFFSFEFYGLF